MRALNETVVKKSKRNLERACKGGGGTNIMPSFQGFTDISREEFRDTL